MVRGRFLFLGTGASSGVPMIGCSCAVCRSDASQNQRMRSAGLLSVGDKRVLIDVGPEFRLQALRAGITHLDGVFLTHAHADHIGGIDDLRALYFLTHQRMPCFLSEETLHEIRLRYHYLFAPKADGKSVSAQIDFHPLQGDKGSLNLVGIGARYFSYYQQEMKVSGLRVGTFAYVSDIKRYSESLFDALKGVEVLVLSALRHTSSAMHFTVDEAVAFAKRVGARQTYLTHLSHELEHHTVNALLPEGVQLGYDGLEVEFESDG